MVKLSIIVLSYNTKKLVIECLSSLEKEYRDQFEKEIFEVIVADNNSSDGTLEDIVKHKFGIKKLKLIQFDKNLGYAKGNNEAVKSASGSYVLFLNSDTRVLDSGLLKVIEFMDHDELAGVAGVRILRDKKNQEKSAGRFFNLSSVFFLTFFGDRFFKSQYAPYKTTQVDWVMGAAMIVKKYLFEMLNGFDEHFFMYVEDMEFCLRVKKIGYKVYFYSESEILHTAHGSSNRSFAIVNIHKSLLYYYKKHFSLLEYLIVRFMLTCKSIIAILIGIVTNNKYLLSTYKQAIKFKI